MSRSRERRRRIQALLALGLFLVGGFWGFLHEVAVRHAICPEHGEVVDVAGASSAHEHGADGPSFAPAPDDGEERTHEHCPAVTFVRECSLQPQPVLGVRKLPPPCTPLPPRPAGTSWESSARFLLAPNHSPPESA